MLKLLNIGQPEEYFVRLQRDKEYEIKTAFLDKGIAGACKSLADFQSPNVGLAIQWNQLNWLSKTVGVPNEETFMEICSHLGDVKVLYLKRDDILGQAISLFLKNESGYTTSSDATELKINRETVEYDSERLAWCYKHTLQSYTNWENLLGKLNIDYCQISYEHLCENVVAEMKHILNFINVSRSETEIIECSTCLSKIRNKKDELIRKQALADDKLQSLLHQYGIWNANENAQNPSTI